MYIEQLTTPNPIRHPGEVTASLIETADLANAQERISASTDPWRETTEVIKGISDAIRHSLHYPEDLDGWDGGQGITALESMLRPDQQTDCTGYTTVASEALSIAGIKHSIAYGRRHWFLLVPEETDGDTRIHSCDCLLPNFNTDITDDLSFTMNRIVQKNPPHALKPLGQGLEDHPERQQNIVMHSDAIAAKLGVPLHELADLYPVFWGDPRGNHYSDIERPGTITPSMKRTWGQLQWVLSVYTPETGRDTLEKTDTFSNALAIGNIALAAEQVQALHGRCPENDCRASHREIRDLITKMCARQMPARQTSATIEAYCSSIQTGDPRIHELRGDLYRIVGTKTQDSAAALAAIDAYESASKATALGGGYARACAGKAEKARTVYLRLP